jgi:hypothetical protein
MKTKSFKVILFPVLLLIGCMGGGTETTNGGIQGRISLNCISNAGEAEQCIAAVFSTGYVPDSGIGVAETTFVDTNGRFNFPSLPEDAYNLFIWNKESGQGAYLPLLSPDTVLPDIVLSRTKTFAGTVPDSVSGSQVLFADIIIKGSPFFRRAQANELFALSPVPEGEYRIRALYTVDEAPGSEPTLVTRVKTVTNGPGANANDTTFIDIQ